jgi:acetyl-CoA acyltransferase
MSILPRTALGAGRACARLASTQSVLPNVVFIDGVRIPFQPSGTAYNDLMAYDLQRLALKGLIKKTALQTEHVDYVMCGTVLQEVKTANIAREASIAAGFKDTTPSHTVTQACISANQAICSGASFIRAGQYDVVVAGGVETFSDVPIRYQRALRKALIAAPKVKSGLPGYMKLLKGLSLKDLAPEAPAIANFATGEVMGHNADRLADRFGITRAAQDEFALRSHVNAAKAHADGIYADEIVPVDGNTMEGGIRGDSKLEKLASLKPAFVKPYGTVTAANSSYLTDGASACLVMSEAKAKALGYKPKAYIREYMFVSQDPFEDLLLGPAYATYKLLKKAGLTLKDIDVIEYHEAFAAQVLANLAALDSDAFAKKNLPGYDKVGAVDMSKFNVHGGSLSIGHPFGATGTRLVTTVANRLIREGGRFGLLAACADGGVGHAALIERYP